MASIFNKKLSKSCSFCVHGNKSEYSDEIFCAKHGVTNKRDYCRHYKYDILKRVPDKVKPTGTFSEEDFSL
ncbi:MAG: hypothetical protein IJZ75_02585 [Clostridia bacterium]|nr:hypothetical protein [Clostridia bacterium]